MRNRIIEGLCVGLLLAGVATGWPPATRAATCGIDAAMVNRADVVFVGRPTAISSAGDHAFFAVDEVWTGADLGSTVEVVGAAGQWDIRAVEDQVPYVVVAAVVDGSLVVRNDCDVSHPSLAQPWESSYDGIRPATAHPPSELDTVSDPPLQLILAAAVVAVLVIVSALAFRRTRTAT